MGNETNIQENENNNSKHLNNEEIPADTQLTHQYIEKINNQENQYNYLSINEKENQDPNHMTLKEIKFQNNEKGPNTQINERKVEYQIRKVNQDYDSNAEEEYAFNQGEELENEEYQEGMEYDNNINQIEQNMSQYQNNSYTQDENNSKEIVVINKTTSSNSEEYQNKNLRIIPGSTSQGRYTQIYSDIPRFMSFQKSKIKGSTNIKGNLNVVKTENTMELVEIPKSEYPSYVGKETVFIGGGMETGEYKFQGQGIVITQIGNIENKVVISEEEILKEIERRNNKPKKEKRKKIEIIDKFYAITQFDGKPIYKTEKMEQLLKQNELNQQNKFPTSSKKGISFQFKKQQNQEANSQIDNINKNNFDSKYEQYQQSYSKSQMNSKILNINNNINKDINLKYKDLDKELEPKDNFSKIIFNKINKLRTNPQSYIKTIEECKKNIFIDNKGRLIYNSKIKIALTKGKQAFNDAINFLKTVKPSQKLIFNPYLTVDMPKNENEIKNKNDLEIKVENLINKGFIVKSFWRDVIKDPEISFLMTIVDDIGVMNGMRRKDLLDNNMKYIGINSIDINGNFVCYIILSN